MGIVTSGAIFDHPLTGPVGDAFTVGATYPVFFMPEVALTAHLVAVIHIDFGALFGYQEITLIFVMAGITGQGACLAAMIQGNLTMGNFSGSGDPDRFIIVTLTAFKTLYLVLAGLDPEAPPLISFRHQNGRYGKGQGRIDLPVIEMGVRFLINLGNAPASGISALQRQKEQRDQQDAPQAFF
jgi:hypothetical protein